MSTSFKLEHIFAKVPLDKFIAHLNDPKLNDMLKEDLQFIERTLISREESPEAIEWQFQVRKEQAFPSAIKKVIKDDIFSWQETSRFVREENCIYWSILPQIKAVKIHGEGTWRLFAHRKGTKRVIEGQVEVELPLLGKAIEKIIVAELLKTFQIEPATQEKFYSHVN